MEDGQGARGTIADGRWHERLRSLILEEERPGARRHSHHGYRKERLPFFVQRCYIFAKHYFESMPHTCSRENRQRGFRTGGVIVFSSGRGEIS